MKKILDAEKFDLGDAIKRGLSVRDGLVNEFNLARSKFAQVNWHNEFEAFKKNPMDTAQSYLNQVNEALRNRTEHTTTTQAESSGSPVSEVKPVAKRKSKTTRTATKSPRTKKPAAPKADAKTPAVKKVAVKKVAAKSTATQKVVSKKPVVKKTTTVRATSTKSKGTRTTAKTGTAQ